MRAAQPRRIAARDVPRAVLVLALGFAERERRPLIAFPGLVRGMALQVACRWPLGRVTADAGGTAVLLWSPVGRARVDPVRAVLAVALTVVVALGTAAVVAVPVWCVLVLAGMSAAHAGLLVLAVWGVMQLVAASRAATALRTERSRIRATGLTGRRLDYLVALPRGCGHGIRLLRGFLDEGDAAGQDTVLVCTREHRGYYAQSGFRLFRECPNGSSNVLMHRPVRQVAESRRRHTNATRRA